jgi:predicted metal-dependent phosphoesterase TrpH
MASEPITSAKAFRADLHVHSYQSPGSRNLRWLKARDCYSPPREVYRRAKQRGMSLVTITDHDTLDGCLELLDAEPDLPDFLTGEEVTAYVPGDAQVIHVAVYGLDETQHREIQRLRWNVEELAAYLRQENLFFALNHPFFRFPRTKRLAAFVERFFTLFPAFEARNGAMRPEHNELIGWVLELLEREGSRPGRIAGSDSHTLIRIGTTYTASHAQSRSEFLADLRAGRTFAGGRHGGHRAMAGDAYGVVLRYLSNLAWDRLNDFRMRERVRAAALVAAASPLALAPLFIAFQQTYQQRRLAARARAALNGRNGDSSAGPSGGEGPTNCSGPRTPSGVSAAGPVSGRRWGPPDSSDRSSHAR